MGIYEASADGITGTIAVPRLILAAAVKSLSGSIIYLIMIPTES